MRRSGRNSWAIGETAIGASLLIGLFVRLSSLVGVFMVLNFYAANGSLYSLSFFGGPWSALLSAGLLILSLREPVDGLAQMHCLQR